MNRALNFLSGGLLVFYIVLRWDETPSKLSGAGWAWSTMGITAILLVVGEVEQTFRPTMAMLLTLLILLLGGLGVYASVTHRSVAGAFAGLFGAPTILLAICVQLAGGKPTIVATLVAVLSVVGSGAWAYQAAPHIALGAVGVMFVSAYQLLLVLPLTVCVGICWGVRTLREKPWRSACESA